MVLEPADDEQAYVEDCEGCCRPLPIRYQIVDDEIAGFSAEPS